MMKKSSQLLEKNRAVNKPGRSATMRWLCPENEHEMQCEAMETLQKAIVAQ